VIGIVDHVPDADLRQRGLPQIYLSSGARGYSPAFVVRTAGDPGTFAAPVKAAIERQRPGRPVFAVRPLDAAVADATADSRFALFVVGVLAALAASLTAIGVYGVVAYSVARRSREMAVRRALGATTRGLVVLIVREGSGWIALGLVAGAVGAGALSRAIESLLFGVKPSDPATFSAVALVLAAIAYAASAIPALRAGRVDPMLALRSE
jgi:putative ABC transport system permease protein